MRRLLVALVVGLVSSACQAGPSGPPDSTTMSPGVAETSVASASPTGPAGTLVTSEFQAEILADGVVTESELVAALNATVACMRNLGVDAAVSEGNRGIEYRTTTDEELEAATRASDQCGEEYSWDVERLYALGNPDGVAPDAYYDCLIEAGLLDSSGRGDPETVQRAAAGDMQTALGCLDG